MASSTRFFSRKRFARSRCLFTSAAIRESCLCGIGYAVRLPDSALRAVLSVPFTIYRWQNAAKSVPQRVTPRSSRQSRESHLLALPNAFSLAFKLLQLFHETIPAQ